jgi:RHS repeat-associated protein
MPYSTQVQGKIDSIDMATGSVFIKIPVRSKIGKMPLEFSLLAQSRAYIYLGGVGIDGWWCCSGPSLNFTYSGKIGLSGLIGTRIFWTVTQIAQCNGHNDFEFTNFFITDPLGATHSFGDSIDIDMWGCLAGSSSGIATDGSGYVLDATGGSPYNTYTVWDRAGNHGTVTGTKGVKITSFSDPDGSTITDTGSAITDTLGATFLSYAFGSSGTPDTYSWHDITPTTRSVSVSYTQKTLQTNFLCPGIVDIPAASTYLPTGISLPNGDSYTIAYEQTPGHSGNVTGRISQITFSSGGYVAFTYTGGNNGINCNNSVVPTLTRTLYDKTSNTTTIHTYINSAGTVTDYYPYAYGNSNNNQTVYKFSGEFAVQVSEYSGSTTLARQTTACFNRNFTNCSTATVVPPITQIDTYTQVGTTQPRLTENQYDSYGNVTQQLSYDWGAGTPPLATKLLSSTSVPRGSWNSTSQKCVPAVGNGIPCYTKTTDPAGNTTAATYFTYDANGHLLTKQELVTSPSTYLTTTYGYTNGVLTSITEPNSANTQFSNFVCNGVLPTTITYDPSTGLSKSLAWNCDGGVLTSTTDDNGKATNYGYIDSVSGVADPFWRVTSVTDPLANVTNTHYVAATSTTAATQESVLTFNSNNSTVDDLLTFDSLGRVHVSQQKQSPTSSNYDSVETDYDIMGRPYLVTVPYSNTAGATCPTPCPSTQTVYDVLNRPTSVTDGGGGSTTTQYLSNDVLTTVGPAPAAENMKSRQVQYDGLGRVTSVCEILATGGSSCGQSTTASGYKTSYGYSTPSAGGSQMVVTQGAQTRTYVYDALGRTTSVQTPEAGTVTEVYDSTSDLCGAGAWTSNGDLIKTVASGRCVEYRYDGLHRMTDSCSSVSGSYCKRVRYDALSKGIQSAPTGYVANNIVGRLMEAETDAGCGPPGCGLSTDEWFSYDPNGRVTDVWESTPHSGGYYHTTVAYWANGALQSLSGIPGYGSMSYGLDGEGRLATAQQGTTKVVCDSTCSASSSTTFTPGGQPNVVKIGGTSDNDTYTYDPNTGRISNFTFTVGSTPKSFAGGLTWNQNGMLRQLAITDGFNAGGTQTCTYGTSTVMGYDDLGRLLSANCGSIWSQSYSYDQYGNITKAGSISWACASCYNTNNQYNLTLSPSISYDLDGNLLNDTFFRYTWDVYGHVSSIAPTSGSTTCGSSGVTCLTYDANGNAVETNVAGVFSEILYSPVGKTAIMSGQTTSSARFPLPAGETLTETGSSGSNRYFWHKDWLGSVRFASTLGNRSSYFDRAYAPFGESYDNFGNTSGLDFTGDTQDIVAGLFDTPNREYHPTQGRWISPDPAGLGAVDITNPQSWNRYSYVLNNPLANIDPLGLCGGDFDCEDWGSWSLGGILTRSDLERLFDMGNGSGFNFSLSSRGGLPCDLDFIPCGGLPSPIGLNMPCQTDFGAPCTPADSDFLNGGGRGPLRVPLDLMSDYLSDLLYEFANTYLHRYGHRPNPCAYGPCIGVNRGLIQGVSAPPMAKEWTQSEINGGCMVAGIEGNNGTGGVPGDSNTAWNANGVVFSQQTQNGDRAMNPTSSNAVVYNIALAPGYWAEHTYKTCGGSGF